MNKEFIVTNNLEECLIKANNELLSLDDFIRVFLKSELIMPSAIAQQEDHSIIPLSFDKNGESRLSVFTSLPLLELYKEKIKHYLFIDGKSILMQMPPNIGLVINPGFPVGFDISSDGIKNIIKELIGVDDNSK